MPTRSIASYTEKNMNSKIGVQRAMVVDINKNDNSEELKDDSNKKSNKSQGRKRKNVTPN
jgi:hypothetical protein